MPNEEDPKIVARNARALPETEQMLRQFLDLDGPKGSTNTYREGWDRIFGKKDEPEPGVPVEQILTQKANIPEFEDSEEDSLF